jgi:hypothetical protein
VQAIAAYLIFMLAFTALGLTIIVAGAVCIALFEGASWVWSRLSSTSAGGQRIGPVLSRAAKQNIQHAADLT